MPALGLSDFCVKSNVADLMTLQKSPTANGPVKRILGEHLYPENFLANQHAAR